MQNEIDRVNLEIQSAERDYDLNRAAELKYGTLLNLQKQLKEAEHVLETKVSRLRKILAITSAKQNCPLFGSVGSRSCTCTEEGWFCG